MFRIILVCCVAVAVQGTKAPSSSTATAPSAEGPTATSDGQRFRGSWMESRRGRRIHAYRGIRYAQPPTGELRFQPPKPMKYAGEVDASQEGPACPQPTIGDYYVDEDCLRLNVYVPETKGHKPLPVLVYIHSGGFYSISGRSDVAGPQYLLDHDVLLVTINYRLASLGFISTGDELAPGNNGLKDQVVALRWVQKYISGFGGDPHLVTVAGCSAGAFSVLMHMVSPMTKGLFHRAISISGSPISQVELPHHQRFLAERQAKLLNCPTTNTKAMMDCLKAKPWRDIGNSLVNMFDFGYDPTLLWRPIIELDFGQERYLDMDPADSIRQGKMHPVPYMLSRTADEFFWKAFSVLNNETLFNKMNEDWEHIAPISFLLPKKHAARSADRLKEAFLHGQPLRNDSFTAEGLGDLYEDSLIGYGVHRTANLMCRRSPHPVYYYKFSYIGNQSHYEDPVTGRPVGAAHHDDLIYLFSLTASFTDIPLSSPDSFMVDRMTTLYYNFARFGDPNTPHGEDQPSLKGIHWPTMTPHERKYLIMDRDGNIGSHMFEARYNVWDELYPPHY